MEKITKSKKRVKDFAEVFTPQHIVKEMCDLIPDTEWTIKSTFLEPACGNGNFLAEIFYRKLKLCKNEKDGIKALYSIFGIDIQADNVNESRERLLKIYSEHFPNASILALVMANKAVTQNIISGDSLLILNNLIQYKNLKESKKI